LEARSQEQEARSKKRKPFYLPKLKLIMQTQRKRNSWTLW